MQIFQKAVPKSIRGQRVSFVAQSELAFGDTDCFPQLLFSLSRFFRGGQRGANLQECLPAATTGSVLIVINSGVTFEAINLADEKTVHMKITPADHKGF